MHPADLQQGDIILFHTKTEIAGITTIKHVAMYTGHINGRPHVTHSVRRIGDEDKSGVTTTVLKELDEAMGGRIEVYRPLNAELGKIAAEIILHWVQYRVPYDLKRAKWMQESAAIMQRLANKDGKDPTAFLLTYLTKQAKIKFYERIKFAARRETCPVKMLVDTPARGFTCVQAVILAYQIAELQNYVKPLRVVKEELAKAGLNQFALDEVWISDKHCPEDILDTYKLPDSYVEYCELLRDEEEFDFPLGNDKRQTNTHPHYHPSLVAWDYAKAPDIDAFIAQFDSCLNLPAKFCFTDGLYAFLHQHPRHWQCMGNLEIKFLDVTFSAEAKALHARCKSDLDLQINSNRAEIIRARTLSSPGNLPRSLSASPRFFETKSLNSTPSGSFRNASNLGVIDEQDVGFSLENTQRTGMESPILERHFAKRKLT